MEHCSTLRLPGRTELALTVLLGRTFLLQMELPIQTELALTGLLDGTLLQIAFTWANRTSTDSLCERTFLLQMGLPIRTEPALMGLLGGTLLHIAFTWTNRTRAYNFNDEYTKRDGITNRYNMRECGEIF